MGHRSLIPATLSELRPQKVLDVGCGCGCFTVDLAPHCGQIVAVDISSGLIAKCREECSRPNLVYETADARRLPYPDGSFDLVLERASLHHIVDWQGVVSEMLRVSSRYVLVEEPVDDPRSAEKRVTMRAQALFLEVQAEVGYPHFPHLTPAKLTGSFEGKGMQVQTELMQSDRPIEFADFFDSYGYFAEKSSRKDYWLARLETLRAELQSQKLCENDLLLIVATKSLA